MSPRLLVDVLQAHGFTAQRTVECVSPGAVAQVANASEETSTEEFDRVDAEEGHVMCDLFGSGNDVRVDRTHYPEDRETYVDVLNVSCAIFPAPEREREQVARLERALRAVARHCRRLPGGPTVRCARSAR